MHRILDEDLSETAGRAGKARRRVDGRVIGQPFSDCQHASEKKMTPPRHTPRRPVDRSPKTRPIPR